MRKLRSQRREATKSDTANFLLSVSKCHLLLKLSACASVLILFQSSAGRMTKDKL